LAFSLGIAFSADDHPTPVPRAGGAKCLLGSASLSIQKLAARRRPSRCCPCHTKTGSGQRDGVSQALLLACRHPRHRQRTTPPPMTLPDDYARCHGRLQFAVGVRNNFRYDYPLRDACVHCLRRTSIAERPNFMRSMEPPDFTTTCPERIAP